MVSERRWIKINNPLIKKNKGMVLIFSYFVLVVMLGLAGVAFVRSINESRLAQRCNNSMQAFYAAEAGIAYAYAEAGRQNFEWYTHQDKDTPAPTPIINMPDASINASGYYQADGKDFQVKTYPEKILGVETGVLVILSQATVNNITRTIEYRVGQESAYKYFFFYPQHHTFGTVTLDGRNYGGIHVNGNIFLEGEPQFHFLTELTSGSNTDGQGYILRPLRAQFPDLHGDVHLATTISDPTRLNYWMHDNINPHFYYWGGSYAYFRSGEISSYTSTTLYPYLNGSDADWEFDKYAGDGSDTTPYHVQVWDDDLKNLATYELTNRGTVALLSDSLTVDILSIGEGTEKAIFEQMYKEPETQQGLWNKFWSQWKANHANETSYTAGEDWERRFFAAAYNWNIEEPVRVNREWWEDLEYGTDRELGDMQPAEVVNNVTGAGTGNYFLNTEEQASVWGGWLNTNNLDEAGENKTRVQDRSQGGKYINPGDVVSTQTDYNAFKEKAETGGIYIGLADDGTTFINPIADITEERQFYNAQHPARACVSPYAPTSILVIDVKELKAKIDNAEIENFNGLVYIDLTGRTWLHERAERQKTYNAEGIMLVNAERLPDGGLSIVTSNNVYIKGNYNLDPDGVDKDEDGYKEREPDDGNVIERVIANKAYLSSWDDLEWQPAEVITNRAVYTLSEDFPEPAYMPLPPNYGELAHEEGNGSYDWETDYVNHAWYPTNYWVPSPSETVSALPGSEIAKWFAYYDGAPDVATITDWQTWVVTQGQWPDNEVFNLGDIDGDTQDDYVLGKDLRTEVQTHIENVYRSEFSYANVHGADGSQNPNMHSLPNDVAEKHIYNTAIVTPYETTPYVLEKWNKKDRTLNGAFIQLPDDAQYAKAIPWGADYSRRFVEWYAPTNYLNYETRFGRGSTEQDRPNAGLTFGADSSWREVNNGNF